MFTVNTNEEKNDFSEIFRKYYPKIFNFISHQIINRETAEDITSETFFKALRYLAKNKQKINNFSAWIHRIATNELLSHLRKKGNKNILSLDDEKNCIMDFIEDNKADFIDTCNKFIDIRNAVKKLKPKDAVLTGLFFFEKKNYKEISEILNMKEVTIRSKVHRILKKLKKEILTD